MSEPSSEAPTDVGGESEDLPAPFGRPAPQELNARDPIPAWASELRKTCLELSQDVRDLKASVALLLPPANASASASADASSRSSSSSSINEARGNRCTCACACSRGDFETSVLAHLEARRLSDQQTQASAGQLAEWLDALKRDIQWSFRVVDVAHGDFKGEMTDTAEHVVGMASEMVRQGQSIAGLREMTEALAGAVREILDKLDEGNAVQLQRLAALEELLARRIEEGTRPGVEEPVAVPVAVPEPVTETVPVQVPVEERAVRNATVSRAQKRLGLKKKRQAGQKKLAEDQDSGSLDPRGGDMESTGGEAHAPVLEGSASIDPTTPSSSAPCPKRPAGQKNSKDIGKSRGSRRPAAGKQPTSAGDASPSPERVLRSAKKREARFKWQK